MNLSIGTVREVLGGQLMTVSEIARAGGWSFDETAEFMHSVAVDDEEGRGGVEHFLKAGVGTVYKWICSEDEKSKRVKTLKFDEQDSLLIAYLKKNSACTSLHAREIGLSTSQFSKTVLRLAGEGVIVKAKDNASFYVYSLAFPNAVRTSGIFG